MGKAGSNSLGIETEGVPSMKNNGTITRNEKMQNRRFASDPMPTLGEADGSF